MTMSRRPLPLYERQEQISPPTDAPPRSLRTVKRFAPRRSAQRQTGSPVSQATPERRYATQLPHGLQVTLLPSATMKGILRSVPSNGSIRARDENSQRARIPSGTKTFGSLTRGSQRKGNSLKTRKISLSDIKISDARPVGAAILSPNRSSPKRNVLVPIQSRFETRPGDVPEATKTELKQLLLQERVHHQQVIKNLEAKVADETEEKERLKRRCDRLLEEHQFYQNTFSKAVDDRGWEIVLRERREAVEEVRVLTGHVATLLNVVAKYEDPLKYQDLYPMDQSLWPKATRPTASPKAHPVADHSVETKAARPTSYASTYSDVSTSSNAPMLPRKHMVNVSTTSPPSNSTSGSAVKSDWSVESTGAPRTKKLLKSWKFWKWW